MPKQIQTTNIGAYHFSANKEIYEIQRGNNFEFLIDPALNNMTALGSDTKNFPNAQEYIRLSVASSSVPHFSQNPIEVRRGNTTVKYAGVMSFPSGSIQCYDFIGAETKDILMAWQAKSGNPLDQTVGLQNEYKYTATLVEYRPDYSGGPVRTWKLEGCWISEISEPEYSVDSNDSRRISVTIQYDRAVPVYE